MKHLDGTLMTASEISEKVRAFQGSKKEALLNATYLIWRNVPRGVTTMGPCARECGETARGSGVCLSCARADLAALVGPELAAEYVAVIQSLRTIEDRMQSA